MKTFLLTLALLASCSPAVAQDGRQHIIDRWSEAISSGEIKLRTIATDVQEDRHTVTYEVTNKDGSMTCFEAATAAEINTADNMQSVYIEPFLSPVHGPGLIAIAVPGATLDTEAGPSYAEGWYVPEHGAFSCLNIIVVDRPVE